MVCSVVIVARVYYYSYPIVTISGSNYFNILDQHTVMYDAILPLIYTGAAGEDGYQGL